MVIINSTFEEQTNILHWIYEHIFQKNGVLSVKSLIFLQCESRGFNVRCSSPLFSQVERVSIQFCLPLWRLKNGQEHSIKFQTITYNVLKMRLANLFNVLKPLDIPLFHLKHFHAPENMSFWWVLTGNVIGKPATLSLNMPLDLLSLHRASYA